MLLKTLLAALTISLVGGIPMATGAAPSTPSQPPGLKQDAQDLERLLPSPSWIVENRDDLGIDDTELRPLRDGLKQTRRVLGDQRKRLREVRADMRRTLAAEPLDRARVEPLFEAPLRLENDMKRTQLSARLDFITHISAPQRARVRSMSERAPAPRRPLRRRIEGIRSLGRKLRDRGVETRGFREQLPRIERLIRAGRLREALMDSSALRDELSHSVSAEKKDHQAQPAKQRR